ncbi:SURF1 family cytochrome oxidase biogenesis protein [Streptomyces litchfieldiae]|uniref:SURF1-like protein n=1 Tax=Streptomyces litchfieldiae TaxID=3075543 RepID=A0ABU2MTA4_9ACTN|nr:SURF1 family protein [Streptomyces sp. DSM 44938]MDT0344868.1 SURF1 family protein [Streptomyces sp. DSM 44938]
MYRFLLSRQWVILTLVALLLIPAMIWLGFWQLDRHEQRVARNDLIAASLAAPPVPMAELSPADGEVDPDDRYRPVTATGVYDTGHQVVVRQRTNDDGAMGYYVLTPLIQADGTAALVNRGWVPAGNDVTRVPEVAEPPGGEVTVTGRLMADETTGTTGIRERSGLPDGMVMMISSQERAEALGAPVLGGYLELTGTEPAPADADAQPEMLPEPDHTGIGAHFAYAVQWWLFAAGVPVGWALLLRREVQDRRKAAARARRDEANGDGGGNGDDAEAAGRRPADAAPATS